MKGKVIFFVTSNIHKFNEARRILREYKISTAMLKNVDAVEVQDDDIENVAKANAIDAVRKCKLSIVVEDTGLFIKALKDFPGPYSSFVHRTIGNDGILRLMENITDRSARFKSIVAFLDPLIAKPFCFTGEAQGKIIKEKRGSREFGFDPIFVPSNSTETFAEMSIEEKNQHSHRALAFRKFAKWYSQISGLQKS
ncbi:MAG: XTP/dITP diphosphatase [Candidatus Bathyarchaeota archaeon]|nr:MAG: XTP/dITP diphosphatase [Candidatus Bathyarchaeota archaeon]